MESQKIYLSGNGGGSDTNAALIAALQNRGLDPNAVFAALNNNGNGGMWGNNDFFSILLLFILMGAWGGNGFGGGFGGNGGGLPLNMLSNDSSRELIMSAIQRNGTDISALAQTLNCSVGQVMQGINNMALQISNLSAQTGQSAMQIINAVQAGNCQLGSQLASCCCEIRTAIERQGYETRIATAEQTATLGSKIDLQTTLINDKFCQLEMREMQNKLDAERAKNSALTAQLSQEHQTAQFGQIIAGAVAPIGGAVTDLSQRLAKIECSLPEVAKVPYSPVVGVPTCVAAQYGLAGLGLGNGGGFWGVI